jgi:hypothetical protein
MQGIEYDIRTKASQHLRDIAVHIDAANLISDLFQSIGDPIAAH